ncbi:MAG: metallophosphoesterase family protein [Bacteroidia bacterium]|nr:metallophosphoesterase family protein [Bacteroidia bacterium]
MKKIGILSDTHGFLNTKLFDFFTDCDEIWHAGDWGSVELFDTLEKFKPLRGVYGNIDGKDIRVLMPESLSFKVEGLSVCMLHIGGYPGNYSAGFKKVIRETEIDLMVCGHSHILKVMRDPTHNFLHINPGACGNHGFHQVNTAIRLKIESKKMFDLEIWEQKRNL